MKTRELVLSALFAALLCVCAAITIPLPFTPVPITLQVLAVMVCAASLSRGASLRAIGLYLLLGAVGLPVFSGMRGGFAVLAGPTGGYLWGFLPAAMLMGTLHTLIPTRGKGVFQTALYMVLGLIVIYFFGTLQFSLLAGKSIGACLAAAVIPFVPFDLAKIVLAVPIALAVRRLQQQTA